jgi:two-component system CheB/CheR fusion protein
MKKFKKDIGRNLTQVETDFIERLSKESLKYLKTIIDVVREPILILDKNLRVIVANGSFYDMFQVEHSDTENNLVYKLGNGQWNIPVLRKLLKDILPKNSFFKGFEVVHKFPTIGNKVIVLNARQINFKENTAPEIFPPIIFLAMEDFTPMMEVARTLAVQVKELANKNATRTLKLEAHIKELKRAASKNKKNK